MDHEFSPDLYCRITGTVDGLLVVLCVDDILTEIA